MIINNFEQIQSLLIFDDKGDWFYHLQLLLRKKDMPEVMQSHNSHTRCIKTYYITSIEQLKFYEAEIIKLCEVFGARAYINLNAKSFEKTSFELNAQLADRLKFKQFNYCYRLYETVVGGGYSSENEFDKVLTDKEKEIVSSRVNVGDKRWIVDIDTKDVEIISDIEQEICKCKSSQEIAENGFYKNIYDYIPTKDGWHIITCPFNLKQFKDKYPEIDIHRNNPTLCYYNDIYTLFKTKEIDSDI